MSDIPPSPDIIFENYLPLGLIENILSRLPLKILKRFRAVEKSWCRLIDSKLFAKTHLEHSLASKSNRYLISGWGGFNWMSVDSLEEEAHSIKLDFEYHNEDIDAISNSCNGLVVVKRDPEPPIMFNPFSREYKVLPLCPHSSRFIETSYGFSYDSKNDDYKVVKSVKLKGSLEMKYEEWIYSLRSDCWRRRTEGNYYGRVNWPTHVKGVLHTVLYSGKHFEIMGFSVETEEDFEVAKPKGINMVGLIFVRLDVLNGDLALICVYHCWFVIWVMEEYGVKESWTMLASFGVEKEESFQLLVNDSPDKFLIHRNCEELVLLDMRKRSEKLFDTPYPFYPRLCVESLVSPHGWATKNCSADKLKKEHRNKVVKKRKKR